MDNTLPNGFPTITMPKIPKVDTRNYNLADYQHEVIMRSISKFERQLDESHEVALKLTHVGQSITLHITDLGHSNPCLIHYYGYVSGQFAELIQHVNQINFLLVSVPKENPEKPARRIGFSTD